MKNRLARKESQQEKLVNNDLLSINTNNVVDFDHFLASNYAKNVNQNKWLQCSETQQFISRFNLTPSHVFLILAILYLQNRNGHTYHSAIASFTGYSEQTVRRNILKLVQLGVIHYISGGCSGGVKYPSVITFLTPLPSEYNLKSYACNKSKIAKHINSRNFQKLYNDIRKSRQVYVDKKQNVYLYNTKVNKTENTQVSTPTKYKELEYFSLTEEMFKEAEEKYLVKKWQLLRHVERYKTKKLLEGVKTKEKWHSDFMNLVKTGRATGYDYTPSEMEWYQEQMIKAHNENAHEHSKNIIYLQAKASTDYSLSKEGIANMIADKYDANIVSGFNGWVKEIRQHGNMLIFYIGTSNHFPPRPDWENSITRHHADITNFRYEPHTRK